MAYVLGGLAFLCCAKMVLPVVPGNRGGIGTPEVVAILLLPFMKLVAGVVGGISGYLLAGRFLSPDERVAWKLSLVGGLSVGISTLVVVWHDANFLTGAVGLTVAWATIPHLLKWKKII